MLRQKFKKQAETRGEAFFHLHLAVFLFGFTAILGKLISVSGISTVWFRMGITTLSFVFLPGIWLGIRRLDRRLLLKMALIGFLLSLHWAMFFGAIKVSNVSVTLCCIATSSFFTALLEPLFLRKRVLFTEVLLGLLVIPGIYLIYRFSDVPVWGIVLGLGASFVGSIFSVMNKKWVTGLDPVHVTFAELGMGFLFFSPFVPFYFQYSPQEVFMPQGLDWLWLLILSLLCTSVAYVSSLKALKVLSTFTVNLTINLEPVYGIVLAIILFQEHKEMGWGFYFGAFIVIGSVFLHPLLEERSSKAEQQ